MSLTSHSCRWKCPRFASPTVTMMSAPEQHATQNTVVSLTGLTNYAKARIVLIRTQSFENRSSRTPPVLTFSGIHSNSHSANTWTIPNRLSCRYTVRAAIASACTPIFPDAIYGAMNGTPNWDSRHVFKRSYCAQQLCALASPNYISRYQDPSLN